MALLSQSGFLGTGPSKFLEPESIAESHDKFIMKFGSKGAGPGHRQSSMIQIIIGVIFFTSIFLLL